MGRAAEQADTGWTRPMIHVAELDTVDTVDTATSHDTAADMKTLAIVGGTGGTGKWAVKGALVRGYKVWHHAACCYVSKCDM